MFVSSPARAEIVTTSKFQPLLWRRRAGKILKRNLWQRTQAPVEDELSCWSRPSTMDPRDFAAEENCARLVAMSDGWAGGSLVGEMAPPR
jgi:hypothetical protein